MKVYYFLNSLSKDDFNFFTEKIKEIKSLDDIDTVLWKYVHKIWEINDWCTQRAAFVEACIFLQSYIENINWSIWDIQWVHERNFLISNDEVFEYFESKWINIWSNILFVTSRDSWKHPFFSYIRQFWRLKNIYLVKPNGYINLDLKDKISYLYKIWKHRDQYVWNVIIPLLMTTWEIDIKSLLLFVRKSIGKKSILKNNFWVQWQNVQAIDSSYILSNQWKLSELKKKFFDKNIYSSNGAYFTDYYNISKEFRIYFTKNNCWIKFYSVKNRKNKTKDGNSIFLQKDFTYNNLTITWDYCEPKNFVNLEDSAANSAKQIISSLDLDIWVLELCRCIDGSIRFIEVNPMWWTLMHSGNDEKGIKDYYLDMWQKCLDLKNLTS